MSFGFKIIIEGDYACFTRPEFKVERVSYDVPTPGALEGLLKSVFWKPAIRYVIDKIIVFNPIDFANIRRNEVKEKVSLPAIKKQMQGKDADPCIYADSSRSQRATMLLKNVKYGVEFHFVMTGIKSEHSGESQEKYYNIIKRRLEKGQHFKTPCLGCAEFPVKRLELVEAFDLDLISSSLQAQEDLDLGYMLYRLEFKDGGVPLNNDWKKPVFSDEANAVYYRPHLQKGIIDVAKYRENLQC